MIHCALAARYRTEADARAAFGLSLLGAAIHEPYRGIWTHPTPEHPLVHVFTDLEPADIEAAGWGPTDYVPRPDKATP